MAINPMQLLKIKGTLQAIELAGNALVKAAGIPGTFDSKMNETEHTLVIKLPQELSDITLFLDLLPYIIPFGIKVSIVRTTVLRENLATEVSMQSSVRKVLTGEAAGNHPLGLINIKNNDTSTGVVADYLDDGVINNDQKPVVGLLSTSPIITFEP